MDPPPTKSHMIALGLMPGVRTQGIRWSCQEVHHCATCVMIEKCPYIYGLSTNPVKLDDAQASDEEKWERGFNAQ